MERIKLMGTELEVSPICLGTAGFGSRIDKDTAFRMLDRFADAGGCFVDTANIYARDRVVGISRSEEILGLYCKERHGTDLMIATKGAHYDLETRASRVTRECITADLEESLRSLGRDCIDFYWLHRDDLGRPIEEIVDIMEDLVRAGKIRYYGASNYTVDRLAKAKAYAESIGAGGFAAVSNYWTPLKENEGYPLSSDTTLVTCRGNALKTIAEMGLSLIPFSSTAKGWVAKGAEGASDKLNLCFDNSENREFRAKMIQKAEAEGCGVQTALLRYMSEYAASIGLQLIPITACSNFEQLEEILKY